jgi:hypothetical protein
MEEGWLDRSLTACDVCTTYRHSQRVFSVLNWHVSTRWWQIKCFIYPTVSCSGAQAADLDWLLWIQTTCISVRLQKKLMQHTVLILTAITFKEFTVYCDPGYFSRYCGLAKKQRSKWLWFCSRQGHENIGNYEDSNILRHCVENYWSNVGEMCENLQLNSRYLDRGYNDPKLSK